MGGLFSVVPPYNNLKSRDKMDALDWPLTRMRSLHLCFGGWSDSNPPKRGARWPLYYFWHFIWTFLFKNAKLRIGKKKKTPLLSDILGRTGKGQTYIFF